MSPDGFAHIGDNPFFFIASRNRDSLTSSFFAYSFTELTDKGRKLIEQGKKVYIGSEGSELYSIYKSPIDGSETRGSLACEDVGSHATYVVEITDEGEIIVSSWGKKYIIDISDLERLDIIIFDY